MKSCAPNGPGAYVPSMLKRALTITLVALTVAVTPDMCEASPKKAPAVTLEVARIPPALAFVMLDVAV